MARYGFVSPWARNALRAYAEEIAAGPDVIIGMGGRSPQGPWSVRLWTAPQTRAAVELFDFYGSAFAAYQSALLRLPETVEWRGCQVVVA